MTVLAIIALATAGAMAGLIGPILIVRLPEPQEAAEDKVPYREIGTAPRLALWLALSGLTLGVATGARIGWQVALLPWAYFLPIGVVLSYIDLRTRLLPTRLIAPSYGVVVVLIAVAAALQRSLHLLILAAIAWAVVGGLHLALWLIYPPGLGYGDVRLSGIMGLVLGCVGWQAVVVGTWLAFLLGGMSGIVLRRVTGLKLNAQGPAMVVSSVLGVVVGTPIMQAFQR